MVYNGKERVTMADMKEYIVWVSGTNDIYLVSAKNAKDAIEQVWEMVQEDGTCKKDIKARSTGSLHNEQGKVVMLY